MQHEISLEDLAGEIGKQSAQAMTEAVERCVHCGFCLATCPTYVTLGEEMDSPRGRIVLMKEALEGGLDLEDTLVHLDRCLGCVACETSCPSGVEYGSLLHGFRARAEPLRSGKVRRWLRRALIWSMASSNRFRLATLSGRLARPLVSVLPSRAVPSRLRAALDLLPDRVSRPLPLPIRAKEQGTRRGRVALLSGCVQEVLAPEINRAAVELLTRNGIEVSVPRGQGCCGALALHAGEQEQARGSGRGLVKALRNALDEQVDAVVSTAAGCGSVLGHFGDLFEPEDPARSKAESLSRHAVDATVFLDRIDWVAGPLRLREPLKVAYQDACHLAHAQREWAAPRRLLSKVGGLELVAIEEPEICCGSAGLYNLEQPELAETLGERKARALMASGADIAVTANVGCLVQLRQHLDRLGHPLPVRHVLEVLAEALPERPQAS